MKIPNEKMIEAYKALPQPLRAFLSDPSFAEIIQTAASKFNLHVDVQGELTQMITNILLGFLAPTELRTELVSAGVPETQVPELIKELNVRIFEPLQKAMKEDKEVSSEEALPFDVLEPISQPKPIMQSVVALPTPFSPPPKSMPSVPVTPAMAPPASVMPIPQNSAPHMPPVSSVPPVITAPHSTPALPVPPMQMPPPEPEVRTMAHDMQLAKEGGHPEPTWKPSSPARSFQTSSVPNTATQFGPPVPKIPVAPVPVIHPPLPASSAPVPPNLPGQMPAPAAPSMPHSTPPILKEYGVDPYRETPE